MLPRISFQISCVIFLLVTFACKNDDDKFEPSSPPLLRSYEVVTSSGTLRSEFDFNDDGSIAKIEWKRQTPNTTQGSDVYFYNGDKQLTEMVRSITGLNDERIVYRLENEKVIVSEHYINGERLSYLFYDYDEKGYLSHSEENIRVSGGGHARGREREYSYTNDGNLSQIKEYSFNESNAQLVLESVLTFSDFTSAVNPLQPIDPLPNIIFQNNLPKKLTIDSGGHVSVYSYQYTLRSDGFPAKRTAFLNNALVETLTYSYQ